MPIFLGQCYIYNKWSGSLLVFIFPHRLKLPWSNPVPSQISVSEAYLVRFFIPQ